MSQPDFRDVLFALFPRGELWQVRPNGDWDKTITAKAANIKAVADRLYAVGEIRDPYKTTMLPDLEEEYRIVPDKNSTEDERRADVAAVKYGPVPTGGDQYLQSKLEEAGFDLVVQSNDPAINPILLAAIDYQMVAGGGAAFAGNAAAFAGEVGGEVIVNQEMYNQSIGYLAEANGANTFAGNEKAVAGYFEKLDNQEIIYSLLMHYGFWNSIFFIAGGFSGWKPLNDWNMEKPNNVDWTLGAVSEASKDRFGIITAATINDQPHEYVIHYDDSFEEQFATIPDLIGSGDGVVFDPESGANIANIDGSQGPSVRFQSSFSTGHIDPEQGIDFPDNSQTNVNELTIECIVRPNIIPDISGWVFDLYNLGSNDAAISLSRAGFRFVCDGLATTSFQYKDYGESFTEDEYLHLVGVAEIGQPLKLYINGQLVATSEKTELGGAGLYTGPLTWSIENCGFDRVGGTALYVDLAYCTYFLSAKTENWISARYFQKMRYGTRRLQVVASNNTQTQEWIHDTLLPSDNVVFDWIMGSGVQWYCDLTRPAYSTDKTNYRLTTANITGSACPNGSCVVLNGTNASLYSGGAYELTTREFVGATSFTIEMVAQINAYPATVAPLVGSFLDGSGDMAPDHLIEIQAGGTILGKITIGFVPTFTGTVAISSGVYHHIVLAWTSGDKLKLYIDGALATESAIATGTMNLWGGFQLGKDYVNPTLFLNCNIHRMTTYSEEKDLAYVTAKYNDFALNKICELLLTDDRFLYQYQFNPDPRCFYLDLTGNQSGVGVDLVQAYSKYGLALEFNGVSSELDFWNYHPIMGLTDHTLTFLVKFGQSTTPEYQAIISNNSVLETDPQMIWLDMSSYPTSIGVNYDISDGIDRYFLFWTITDPTTDPYHIAVTREFDSVNTNFKLYIDGVLKDSNSFAGPPIVTERNCQIGYDTYNGHFEGQIAHVGCFGKALTGPEILAEYNRVTAFNLENGSYVEQILETPITVSTDITGVAWGDGITSIPYVMVQNPTTDEWLPVWIGRNGDGAQAVSGVAEDGLKAIRLYHGFTEDGVAMWDDIQIITPVITRGEVLSTRREKLKQTILRHKPMHTWCVLLTSYS